jgi:hypothetical protein
MSAHEGAAAKRPKTGGRKPKKTLAQQLEEGEAANKIASWHDDVLVGPDLAAIYLACSVDDLEEMRAPKFGESERGADGPLFGKNVKKGAVGSNQPVRYRLGALKEWWREREGRTSHDVAVKNNLLGWVSTQEPFFAQPEAPKRRTILIVRAWDFEDPERDELFVRASRGDVRVVWMSPAQAATEQWQSVARHKTLADAWRALLASEEPAIHAALERTEIHAIAREAR